MALFLKWAKNSKDSLFIISPQKLNNFAKIFFYFSMSDLGNKLVVCPYDKRHVMPEKRYMWHLSMNCKAHVRFFSFQLNDFDKKQEKKAEFMLCPFNSLHRIAKESFEEHLKLCENKV